MKKRGFCRFSDNLYWGESVKKHSLVKWRLKHGRGQFTIYCVTRAQFEQDQLDVTHCAFLKQPYYLENPPLVYGIAGGYDEALELIVKMSDDAIAAGYEGRILEYLEKDNNK
ncbi:MAG: hypothetical protein K6G10_12455 [Butyrivibrio sp.]|nr:hypothetical protein [Butyrivibrio sp.]